jgi:chromosome segregation ATPase
MCAIEQRLAAAVLALVFSGSAWAQAQPSREQEQIRRLRQQVQQLQQSLAAEQQAAQAARADATQRAGAAEAQAARAQRAVRGNAARIAELETELATLRSAQQDASQRADAASTELAQTRQALASTRSELELRSRALAERDRAFSAAQAFNTQGREALALCTRHNESLRVLGLELLDRWAAHDWRDALAAKEPFVQKTRVQIENLVQGYQLRIDDATLPR